MKTKRQNHMRGWGRALSALLCLALAVGLLTSVPMLNGLAYAAAQAPEEDGAAEDALSASELAGPQRPCTLTLNFPREMGWDLEEEQTLVDLYQVAPAVWLSGYNVYAYCVDNSMPYYGLIAAYTAAHAPDWHAQTLASAPAGYPAGTGSEWLLFYYAPTDLTAPVSDWQGLVEVLADAYFGPEAVVTPREPEQAGAVSYDTPCRTTVGTQSAEVDAGLYLSVVHGDLAQADYAVREPKDAADPEAGEQICTIAYSDTRIYSFQPQLISLPGMTNAEGEPITDTTQAGATWQYRVGAVAKGMDTPRFAELEITKSLAHYGDPVTFVFRVTALDPETNETVFEKVIPLSFGGAGNQTSAVLRDVIPVGSTVIITEEYGGAGYRFGEANVNVRPNGTGPAPTLTPTIDAAGRSVTITNIPGGSVRITTPEGEDRRLPDGSTETVLFTNDHDDTNKGGGSVVNSFAPDSDNGWTWTRRRYDRETGEWVNDPAVPLTQTEEG